MLDIQDRQIQQALKEDRF